MAANRIVVRRRRSNEQVMLSGATRSDAATDRMTLIIEITLSLLIFSASIVSIYLQGI